jgi:hypothetical protein
MTGSGMIEKLTPIDAAILVAAAVMALGAFCPIVHLPVVGTLNYVAGGKGDGVWIVLCAITIAGLVLTGYRRTTGFVAFVALGIMLRALIGFASAIGKAHADFAKSMDGNPFAGLGKLVLNSVGLEWGWALLVSGALAVIVLAAIAHAGKFTTTPKLSVQSSGAESAFMESADQRIAEYLENQKISPSAKSKAGPQVGFGKRQRA